MLLLLNKYLKNLSVARKSLPGNAHLSDNPFLRNYAKGLANQYEVYYQMIQLFNNNKIKPYSTLNNKEFNIVHNKPINTEVEPVGVNAWGIQHNLKTVKQDNYNPWLKKMKVDNDTRKVESDMIKPVGKEAYYYTVSRYNYDMLVDKNNLVNLDKFINETRTKMFFICIIEC
jgi:hypothetical protein